MNRLFASLTAVFLLGSTTFFPVSASAKSDIDLLSLVQESGISYESLAEELIGSPVFDAPPKGWYQSYDGSGNNLQNPQWGAANTPFLRTGESHYWDDISEPAGQDRPSPREISNIVVDQDGLFDNDRNLSDMLWQWGQFLDHDIALTPELHPEETFSIPIPAGDPYFDPLNTGTQVMDLNRSEYDKSNGGGRTRPREQMNVITSFIDASNVYGSDSARAAALRTFSGGKLKTSLGELLPKNTDGLPNAGGTGPDYFLAGDIRANEQTALTSIHTLFVREHNYWAEKIGDRSPIFSDEIIYQLARKIVISEMQAITFNEFLPALFGERLPKYSGYDPSVHPGLYNEFSTAAYRLGHSAITGTTWRLDDNGNPAPGGHLSLRNSFFVKNNHTAYEDVGYIMKGLASKKMQEIDEKVVDDLRNFLFGPPGSGGMDLAALNLQRGRDHGLPSYNHLRGYYGLPRVQDFSDITSDPDLQNSLQTAYGNVDKIDPWIGLLSEDHLPGSSVGETLKVVLLKQFLHLRSGDRFWYENTLSKKNIRKINNTRLSDIIKRNTQIRNIQDNVFFVSESDTPTPRPEPTPDPEPTPEPDPDPTPLYCSIGFAPDSIAKGEGTTLWWWTQGVDSAVIDNGIGEVDLNAPEMWFYPDVSGTYTMTVIGPRGKDTCSAYIEVKEAHEHHAPPLCAIGFAPDAIGEGEGTTLWWWTENAEYGEVDNGIGEVDLSSPEMWFHPKDSGTYTMTVSGPGGESTCEADLTISSEYASPPLCAIGFSPAVIQKGQGTALWWWSEGADSGSIDNGIGGVSVPEGYEWFYPESSGTYTITLEGAGGTTTCSSEVIVE